MRFFFISGRKRKLLKSLKKGKLLCVINILKRSLLVWEGIRGKQEWSSQSINNSARERLYIVGK